MQECGDGEDGRRRLVASQPTALPPFATTYLGLRLLSSDTAEEMVRTEVDRFQRSGRHFKSRDVVHALINRSVKAGFEVAASGARNTGYKVTPTHHCVPVACSNAGG